MCQVQTQGAPDTDRDGEWWWSRIIMVLPWVLLSTATILSVVQSGQPWGERGATLALAGVAASWLLVGHTLAPPQQREQQRLTRVYIAGLLVLGALLMARDTLFLIFAITGFFHASYLRPWPWTIAGVLGASVALNTMTMGFPGTAPDGSIVEHITLYVGVVTVQTAAISLGTIYGERSLEEHRQRKHTVARLEAALEENAGLHAQLLAQAREAGVLDERQRLAREIHDTLAQGLTGIITQVQAAQRIWDAPDQASPHLERALNLARDSLNEARRSVQALRPHQLVEAYLPDALSDMARRWAAGTDVNLAIDITGDRTALSPAIEVALFRVAQEALTNVDKHANAGRVGLTLSYLDDVVLLDIRDDGRGINGTRGHGFGLSTMRQRVRGVGGSVEIESTTGEGTAISVSVPAITAEAP